MTDTTKQTPPATEGFDYSQTLFLPQTEFPMRAGLRAARAQAARPLGGSTSIASCARPAKAATGSCCMTARPMPTATSISGT